MKTTVKKIISTVLVFCLCLTCVPFVAPLAKAATINGKCGDNLTWTLDDEGTLTVSGTGDMYDYGYSSDRVPWYNYKNDIKSVVLENGVTRIGSSAFYNYTGLTSVTIPASVTSIGESAFIDCTGLNEIKVSEENTVYHSEGNCLIETASKTLIQGCKSSVIPTDGCVTSIGGAAFFDCAGLTSITIPAGVTSIGDSAFDRCEGLKSITIPDSVTIIGDSAFYKCTGLESITIGNGVKSIGEYAFYECTGLESITIPDSVTIIEEFTFCGCTGLESITIGNCVTSIECAAFENCTGLTSITIPDSVTSIGDCAFLSCSELTSVTIPDRVTSIGYEVFFGCDNLTVNCYENSAAHKYAVREEIPFKLLIDKKDESTSITVTFAKDTFGDSDVSVTFEKKTADSVELPADYEKAIVYDISFFVDNKEVQPNGKVTVKIPVPAGYNTNSLKVYHEKSDGTLEEVKFTLVDGFAVFEATSFSNYILVDTSSKKETPAKPTYTLGDVNGDGLITASDARFALRASVGLEKYSQGSKEFLAADVNKNGKLEASDARTILRVSVGLEKI